MGKSRAMIYDNLSPITREEFAAAMGQGGEAAARALVQVSLFENDQAWAEEQCLAALASTTPEVRLAAVTSAGHLVRRFGSLQPEIVSRLHDLRHDGLVGGMAEDALEDLRVFGA
jgi:hypothetical protein